MTAHYSVPVDLNKLPDVQFSRLEASLAQIPVEQRPMSRAADDIHRHVNPEDLAVDEFEFDDSLNAKDYPLYQSQRLPDVLSAVHFHKHLINDLNFSSDTSINCLKVDSQSQEWLIVNDKTLNGLISEYSLPPKNLSTSPPRKLLAFFIPRIPQTNSSFGNQVTIRKDSVKHLFDTLDVDPSFIMNLLGRPDYWAPCTKLGWDANDKLTSCEFSCQHPRWNLNVQGSPLSAYMRFDHVRNLTFYIVAHKQRDTSISTLQQLIGLGMESVDAKGQNEKRKTSMFLDDPFHIHVMLSYLSFEASKHHVKRFQRFMWTQINKVDDHLAGFVKSDRSKLRGLTKDLQVISQNADSHIANAEVAILCAEGIQRAHVRFHNAVKSPKIVFEHTADTVQYIAASIRKQKMWFNNYKNRKDGTMNLVYNLVTQQDATNNTSLATDMRKDSASMSAIATLTMIFLLGTFTASFLSAGILFVSFGSSSANSSIQVSSMWWLFIAITIPFTIVVFVSWRIYQKRMMRTVESVGDVESHQKLE